MGLLDTSAIKGCLIVKIISTGVQDHTLGGLPREQAAGNL